MNLHSIGIDPGRTVFHLVGFNLREKWLAEEVLSNPPSSFHGQRASWSDWDGSLSRLSFPGQGSSPTGHEVRLMPAQYVKPYVKTNKNGFLDAETIAEAVSCSTMRFVPIKTDEQLDMQSLHRVRERWIMRRTAVVNQIGGLLLERGVTVQGLPPNCRLLDPE